MEVSLGPEMRSTGEVLGVGNNVEEAIFKGLLAAKRVHQIKDRNILVTIRDKDKEEFLSIAKDLVRYGSTLYATSGTQNIYPNTEWKQSLFEKFPKKLQTYWI